MPKMINTAKSATDDLIIGPITLEAKVYFSKGKERLVGSATVGLPPGQLVTIDALHLVIGQTLAALPDGCSLLKPEQFFNGVIVREATGQVGNFATPTSFQYNVEKLSEAGRRAYELEAQSKSSETTADDADAWDEED